MVERILEKLILEKKNSNKAIIILGARQTGKTSLLVKMYGAKQKILWLNGDEPDVKTLFENVSSTRLKSIIGINKTVIIDEAQNIENIGLKLKLIIDHLKEIKVIATGSSSFDLANVLNEPLTGRKWEFNLFPLSFKEMVDHSNFLEEKRLIRERLIYGYYPEVATHENKKEILKQLTDSYLYKDILIWSKLRKSNKIINLLQAIAFQVGNEVSYNELGKTIGLNNETVEHYVNLLEKTYVIFCLKSFSRNLRKELKRSRKIYFYDNGIRNSLIAAFAPIELRQDTGALWENFLISERQKYLHYNKQWVNCYFWRTHDQQEIDYIEEKDGKLYAYEFKWNPNKKRKIPRIFIDTYENCEWKIITQENFDEFLL